MGALHQGHIALIERARKENDITVSSIFVNPLQFNDKKDLEKYPRTLKADIEKLKQAGCDLLFAPSADEMYPSSPGAGNQKPGALLDLGILDKVMEAAHRPGHFQGVCTVVKKLFDIVSPHKAYFGEKDFQQVAVIRHMVKTLRLPVEIIACPTVREADGLAMSSRNTLLSPEERKNAPLIYKTMTAARDKGRGTIIDIKKWVEEQINSSPYMQLEYFEIVNEETLMPVQSLKDRTSLRACIAVKTGAVRLIDNIPF